MKTTLLTRDEVLAGYDAAAALYPHIPSMSVWRGWEYAGYRRFQLPEPILDIGCGDGRFFKLLFPSAQDVVGIDLDATTVEASRQSGVYRQVHLGAAHQMDERRFPPGSFGSAFANCALEHMDELPRVLSNICRSLRPGAPFLFSVVTENWAGWSMLPLLVELAGEPRRAADLRRQHQAYHHLVNGLSAATWAEHLVTAGFEVEQHIPIVPEIIARLVTFFDQLWHLPRPQSPTGEVGGELHPILQSLPDFPPAFRSVIEGAMRMERDPGTGSGAIFWARRRVGGSSGGAATA
jgi:SAM-dependent methyltransferase